MGQGMGLVVYARNLYLIWRERRAPPSPAVSTNPDPA
jgi:hypothetical protein